MFKKLFYRLCDALYEQIHTEYMTPDMITPSPYDVCVDKYGNRIFFVVLCTLKKRGYYNNMAEKKAAMEGTWYNYGWQYSAEQYVLGRNLDPKKYKDCVPANPKSKPWPMHIMLKLQSKMSSQTIQHKS